MAEIDVLFLDIGGDDFARLARDLAARGFGIVANGAFADLIPGARRWESFVPPDAQATRDRELGRIADGITRALADPAARGALTCPRGPFLERTGRRFLRSLVGFLATEIQTVSTLERLARERSIGVIALACDNSHFQRTVVLHARRLGIPTVQLAHGIYGSMKHLSYAANMDTLYADWAAIYGDRAEAHMLALGNDPARIVKTGSPRWDALAERAATTTREEARTRIGLDPHERVVLFACSYAEAGSAFFKAMSRRLLAVHRALAQAMREVGPGVRLLLRPHPTELHRSRAPERERTLALAAYRDWVAELAGTTPVLSSGDLGDAILASDVVVATGCSTVLGAAIHMDRPTINVPLIPGETPTYTPTDGVVFATDDDLGSRIRALLFDSTARASSLRAQSLAREQLNVGHDGSSRRRIVEFLASLASAGGDESEHDHALELARIGDWRGALTLLDDLVRREGASHPRRAELLNDRGVLRHRIGQYRGALEDLTQSLREDPLEEAVLENLHALVHDARARAELTAPSGPSAQREEEPCPSR